MRIKDVPKSHAEKLSRCSTTKPKMGTDPEFFVAGTRNKILASDKFFPGKEKPIKFRDSAGGPLMKLFFDGIQAEINVPEDTCRETVCHYLRLSLKRAHKEIAKKGTAHKLILRPSVRVSQGVLDSADPEARRFGCMPDFNAYTCTQNMPEMDASRHPYRYAGGHIHIGVSSDYLQADNGEFKIAKTEEGHLRIIKFIDYLCGLMLVLMDRGPAAKRRRTKYGNAGCFRPTPYGIEYRTPSCWWLKSPIGQSLAFGMARMAWNLAASEFDEDFRKWTGYDEEVVRGVLDEGDLRMAKKLWAQIRPYAAIVAKGRYNPVHVLSSRNQRGGNPSTTTLSSYMTRIASGKAPVINHDNGNTVFTLAAIEWMIKNGPDCLVSDNVEKEWNFAGSHISNFNGAVSGSFFKLRENKEFHKFQEDFFANVL